MKNLTFYVSAAAMLVFFGCGQSKQTDGAKTERAADSVLSTSCYLAVDKTDTASLSLNTLGNGKISGKLLIKFLDKGKNDGEVFGEFRGDTLFVDYTFKIGTTNETTYKNPLALLKKDGKLLMGVGQIETTLGRSYFVKGKPISFDKGRFGFAQVDCVK